MDRIRAITFVTLCYMPLIRESSILCSVAGGLGRIWATACVKEKTGCVKCLLATLYGLRSQFIHLHFCLICSPIYLFLAQLLNIGLLL